VVVVSGEKARQTFFSSRAFNLTEGFKVLSGAVYYFFAGLLFLLSNIYFVKDALAPRGDLGPPEKKDISDSQTPRRRSEERAS
jgi:hypothetical protein